MAGRLPKNTPENWLEAARNALIEEGISGVKVDRLATRLGVTRGGFYHNFKDRDELLARLLAYWEKHCRFLPRTPPPAEIDRAAAWLDHMIDRLITGEGYDPSFDLAVRDWARSDPLAERAVDKADRKRLAVLQQFFRTLGYEAKTAEIRARVFYYHQIGYYAIGVQESTAERRKAQAIYLDILCGEEALAAARKAALTAG